jgi:hypothetical protein
LIDAVKLSETRIEVTYLLSQLRPQQTKAWVADTTDAVLRQFVVPEQVTIASPS